MSLAEHDGVAAHPLALRTSVKVAHHSVEGARQINIITVDECYNVASDLLETLVDCVHLPAIFFTHPVSQPAFIATNDRGTFVGAATIDHDVFERFVSLLQHGQDRLFQEPSLVKRWRDDAEL